MSVIFKLKDVLHRVTVKLFPAYLPEAKKPYISRAVYQPELDIHGIASKAEVYGVTVPSEVIEEGLTAGMELIHYLAADGYKIKTPVFNLRIGIPGEYEEYDTHLPEGLYTHGLLTISSGLREYLKEKVQLQFDGVEQNHGFIATFFDKETGETNTVLTRGGLIILRGGGLKIASDAEHVNDVGLYYEDAVTGGRIREHDKHIAQNEPTILSAITRSSMLPGQAYYIVVRTQSSVKTSGTLLKHVREIKSDFTVIVPTTTKEETPQP